MRLLDGARRAVEDREARRAHADPLRPASAQQIHVIAIVGQAQDRKRARLDHRNGVQQRCDRRRRRRGLGQPPASGEHGRLDAEAEEAQQIKHIGQILLPVGITVQQPAECKIDRHAVGYEEEHRGEGERRAAERENEIGLGRAGGLLGARVQHERHGAKREQLIEAVHREQIARQRHAERRAVGHREEGEEAALARVVLQIGEGIEHGQRPERRNDRGKEAAEAVEPEVKGQVDREAPERQCALRPRDHKRPRQQ